MQSNWHVIYTHPKGGKKVLENLAKSKIEAYFPVNRVNKHHDRSKLVAEPLFISYIFVKISPAQQHQLRKIDGVINFLYWLGEPAVIPAAEIDSIKKFLLHNTNVSLQRTSILRSQQSRVALESMNDDNDTISLLLPTLGYKIIAVPEHGNVVLIKKDTTTKKTIHSAV